MIFIHHDVISCCLQRLRQAGLYTPHLTSFYRGPTKAWALAASKLTLELSDEREKHVVLE